MAVAKKPVEKKAASSKKVVAKSNPAKKAIPSKAYHVSQHEDGGWKVKGAGSDKSLKRFNTQKEAIDHANKIAKNQDGHVKVHSKTGKLRAK